MPIRTTVLVADDSETVREQVIEAFADAKIDVVEASDGTEALQLVRAGGIDCVITDVNMPRMTGIEMMNELRKEDRFAELPVLVLSIEGAVEQIVAAKQAGASGWVVKPFKAEMLRRAVASLVEGCVPQP